MKYFVIALFLMIHLPPINLQAQFSWEQTGTINGGFIRSLTANSSDHIFAATDSGIFRSVNNGDVWVQIGLQNKGVFSIDINSEGEIFAGTHHEGVFLSTDNGDSWRQIGLAGNFVRTLAIDSSGHIFAGVTQGDALNTGVHRSTDNGMTWVKINNGLTDTQVYVLAINSDDEIFAGTFGIPGGIFRSINNGDDWIQTYSSGVVSFGIHPNGYIFAGNLGVLRSTDNGEHWTYSTTMPVNPNAFGVSSDGQVFCGTDYDGFFDYGGVFKSSHSGDSWSERNDGLVDNDRDIFSLTINSNDVMFVGTRGGKIFRTTQSVASIDDDKLHIPSSFSLKQSFPNPFNQTTTIEYGLTKDTNVVIRIYNTLGQQVRTLVSEHQKAGHKSVVWDGRNDLGKSLSSGVYTYRLEVDADVQSKKMILLE